MLVGQDPFISTKPTLKGVCHEIFDLPFYDSNPSGPPDKQTKVFFEFGSEFVEIFDHKGVSQRRSPRCATHYGDVRGSSDFVAQFD